MVDHLTYPPRVLIWALICCRLTVTDSNGLSAVAHASLLVKPEPYYPPQALAGKDLLIKLPNDKGTLDGSESTAFKVTLSKD